MADVLIDAHTVSVRFTLTEKLFGFGLLRDLEVARTAITSATAEADGLRAARGIRAPGLAIPAVRKIGTWRKRGHRAAVTVRRNEPALSLRLHGHRFDQLLLGAADAPAMAERLSGG